MIVYRVTIHIQRIIEKEYNLYQKNYEKKIQQKHFNRYKNSFNATRQILELIDES